MSQRLNSRLRGRHGLPHVHRATTVAVRVARHSPHRVGWGREPGRIPIAGPTGFPGRIERVVEITRPPTAAWAAFTTAEELGTWFGSEATIDLRPGGAATTARMSGDKAEMRVERVEEPFVFGFTWHICGQRVT